MVGDKLGLIIDGFPRAVGDRWDMMTLSRSPAVVVWSIAPVSTFLMSIRVPQCYTNVVRR